jgi:hypothetical protein
MIRVIEPLVTYGYPTRQDMVKSTEAESHSLITASLLENLESLELIALKT